MNTQANNSLPLTGKVALVTGGSRSIGAAYSKAGRLSVETAKWLDQKRTRRSTKPASDSTANW